MFTVLVTSRLGWQQANAVVMKIDLPAPLTFINGDQHITFSLNADPYVRY